MPSLFERDPRLYFERKIPSLFLFIDKAPEGVNAKLFDFLKKAAQSNKYKGLSSWHRFFLEKYYATDYLFSKALDKAEDKLGTEEKIRTVIDLMHNGIIILNGGLSEEERLKKEEITRAGILKTQDVQFGEVKEYPSARIRKKR